jgi:BirA family transcriptional regulator, biotin operon repressor / biotin---[acetyl-CoA-carboxylase] ligase
VASHVFYDGHDAAELRRLLSLPRLELFDSVGSTLDVAHALAEQGAPAGTLVMADAQTAGRGRAGRSWASAPGAGIWLTLLERPTDAVALEVLSLRLGLHAARTLDRFADAPVALKWPNDLYVAGRKLAGILTEARWRNGRPEWVAVGFGLNVTAPRGVSGAALRPGTSRVAVLRELVPALRLAAAARGELSPADLAAFAERDWASGRACTEPARGVVEGISSRGELLVATASGSVRARGGSLVFEEGPSAGE